MTDAHDSLGKRGSWKLGDFPDRKHMVHAGITVGIIFATIWIVQFINVTHNYGLVPMLSIQPHVLTSLPGIFTAPFVHMSWAHIEGNSLPLLVLGFLAAYRGLMKFAWVTVTIIVVSGLLVWLVSPTGTDTAGASAVIAGWLGDASCGECSSARRIHMMVGGVAGFIYLGAFEFVPNNQGISWQGGGRVGRMVGRARCRSRNGRPSHHSTIGLRLWLALANKKGVARARELTAGRRKAHRHHIRRPHRRAGGRHWPRCGHEHEPAECACGSGPASTHLFGTGRPGTHGSPDDTSTGSTGSGQDGVRARAGSRRTSDACPACVLHQRDQRCHRVLSGHQQRGLFGRMGARRRQHRRRCLQRLGGWL